jgi:hypothetical protein
MKLPAMEDEVLGRCADDYEAPHTIAGDISRDLHREVTEAEVRAAFLSLASKELVQAYVVDRATNRYVPISGAVAERDHHAWFFITAKGRALADEAS